MASEKPDAVVVGSGPNGLAAAITLAREGLSVLVLEGDEQVGGGLRSAELTLPGFIHDICACVYALGVASPFFRSLDLGSHGLSWVRSPAALAHPLDDGSAVLLRQGMEGLKEELGVDGEALGRLMRPILNDRERLMEQLLGPPRIPRHPILLARFGLRAILPAAALARSHLRGRRAQALFAGLAAHSVLPLERPGSAAVGLILGAAALQGGWPLAKGGSQALALALKRCLESLGGEIRTGCWVRSPREIPGAKALLLDLTPRNLAKLGRGLFPTGYVQRLEAHGLGPGAFKMDWALSEPIPWRAKECLQAATVHVGGTLEEIAESERSVWQGKAPQRPFVLLVQPTLFDPGRAPQGMHVAWAYCHVPNGSSQDMAHRIESQIERFAPGFREIILARSVWTPKRLEGHNPNYVGGDFLGGSQDPRRLFLRPLGRWVPYRTPLKGCYICSSSMPPGGGVHGMCGYNAASLALKDLFR